MPSVDQEGAVVSKRRSYSQEVFPQTFEFTSRLERLVSAGVKKMLLVVWEGFDRFKAEVLDKNRAPSREYIDLERDLTEMLYPYLLRAVPAGVPYYLHPEKKERESAAPVGQPPEPDLSFVFYANPRVTFPMDVKVLAGDGEGDLGDYVDTINNRFLTGVYAPFSREGAMLGFLLAGAAAILFESISRRLACQLSVTEILPHRDHRTSEHLRETTRCRYRTFRCHHLAFLTSAIDPEDEPRQEEQRSTLND